MNVMTRVAIIGSGGAGKSTLARALSEQTGLPVIHLDRLYWQPGWVATPHDVWLEKQRQLLALDAWIIDGNYGATMATRLEAADTVIFLDTPRLLCLWRVLKRSLERRFSYRQPPDVPEACPERLTHEFLRWVWDYPESRRPGLLQKLSRLGGKRVVHLRGRRETAAFLHSVGLVPAQERPNDD